MSKGELLSALRESGIQLNEIALTLFAHQGFETSDVRSTIEITEVSVGELGHPHGAILERVFDHAAKRGLTVGPPELAAHLRL